MFSFSLSVKKMGLWYKMIRDSVARVRGGNRTGLSDKHLNRRRSMDSFRNIRKMMKEGDLKKLDELNKEDEHDNEDELELKDED